MRKFGYLLAVIILSVVATASADSLWAPNTRAIAADVKAHKVGDLLNVVIVEASSADQKSATDYSKSVAHSTASGVGPLINLLPAVGFNSSQTAAASGESSTSLTFTATVTAKVVKVLPNGNMLVEGERSVHTGTENQQIKLSGEVRPEDIGPGNTVASTCLSDAKIESTGKGPINDRQKEGFFSRLLKYLF